VERWRGGWMVRWMVRCAGGHVLYLQCLPEATAFFSVNHA
jgi:hypothetical protein